MIIRKAHILKKILLLVSSGFVITSVAFSEPNLAVQSNFDGSPNKIIDNHDRRLWNLQDADILSVINEVSQETGKNFIVDPRVNGKISLISSKPLKKNETYDVFLSVLGMLGYSAIPSGGVIKIVPNMESIEQGTQMATRAAPGSGDEVVVRVIPLQNISASQMIPVLRPMLPQWSNVAAYTPSNVLILLGRASNVSRIYEIIQQVDRSTSSGIQLIPLKHATASQVATVLSTLQAAARAAGEAPSVFFAVDERTNSVLISGPKSARLKMNMLIAQLDNQTAAPSGNTDVVYLRYLKADKLAPLLGKIATNIMGKPEGGGLSGILNNVSATASAKAGSAVNATSVQAEPNTNAIIITAPPALMQAIKTVIAKLDIRPAQVLVEAVIAEVDESNISSLGIQWGSVAPDGTPQTGALDVTAFPTLGAGVVGIMPHTQIQAVLSVLRNQNGVDILSTPSIMVLDNQKAHIEIGQDVPYTNGSYASTAGAATATPYSTTSYKPVTLKLEVTPQINLGTSVRLKIVLKNDTLQNPQNPGTTPIINKSTIDNAVIINSDDMLVLGGLISNSNNENVNKVPILGDLPIVGNLFQQKKTNQQKRNLMVFIKPLIVMRGDDGMTITENKYDQMRSTQANFREELRNVGDEPVPVRMPPWKGKDDLPIPFKEEDK